MESIEVLSDVGAASSTDLGKAETVSLSHQGVVRVGGSKSLLVGELTDSTIRLSEGAVHISSCGWLVTKDTLECSVEVAVLDAFVDQLHIESVGARGNESGDGNGVGESHFLLLSNQL